MKLNKVTAALILFAYIGLIAFLVAYIATKLW